MDTGNSSRTFHRGSIRSSMNEKFYDLKKEKQDRMINAGLRIFALNGYHHASTDEIVNIFYEEGIKEGVLRNARRMKEKGFSTEDIMEITGLTFEEVSQL